MTTVIAFAIDDVLAGYGGPITREHIHTLSRHGYILGSISTYPPSQQERIWRMSYSFPPDIVCHQSQLPSMYQRLQQHHLRDNGTMYYVYGIPLRDDVKHVTSHDACRSQQPQYFLQHTYNDLLGTM